MAAFLLVLLIVFHIPLYEARREGDATININCTNTTVGGSASLVVAVGGFEGVVEDMSASEWQPIALLNFSYYLVVNETTTATSLEVIDTALVPNVTEPGWSQATPTLSGFSQPGVYLIVADLLFNFTDGGGLTDFGDEGECFIYVADAPATTPAPAHHHCRFCSKNATCKSKKTISNHTKVNKDNWHNYIECQCKKGFAGSGQICKDINACEKHPCDRGFVCKDKHAPAPDSPAGRDCHCPAGCQRNHTATGCKVPSNISVTKTQSSLKDSNHNPFAILIAEIKALETALHTNTTQSPSLCPAPTGTCTCKALGYNFTSPVVHGQCVVSEIFRFLDIVTCTYSGDSVYLPGSQR